MEKSALQKDLEETIRAQVLSTTNNDRINVAIGLLNAESSEKTIVALDNLRTQMGGLGYTVGTVIEQQTAKIIESNKKMSESNEYYAKWSKWLAIALIATTLSVGLLQGGILIWQALKH